MSSTFKNFNSYKNGQYQKRAGGGGDSRGRVAPIQLIAPKQIVLSPQQKDVTEWVMDGEGNLILIARAGTGKTSTLMEIAKIIKGRGFMGSFNKAIAEEFKARLAGQGSLHVEGSTLHSAGMKAIRKLFPSIQVDSKGDKVGRMISDEIGRDGSGLEWKSMGMFRKVVGFAKQQCLGLDKGNVRTTDDWMDVIDEYELAEEINALTPMDKFIAVCERIYVKSLSMCDKVIDFDDMLLAPLHFKAPFQKYDWVMVDEAQDTNYARRKVLFEMCYEPKDGRASSTRLIAVGDPMQAIYRFAGANANSLDLIKQESETRGMSVTTLPLNVTYRCPVSVVELAQEWVPDFTAGEKNENGVVGVIDHVEFFKQDWTGDNTNSVVLCRNTRPLVGIAQKLRRRGVPCVVEGSRGEGMLALAKKWGEDITFNEFRGKLAKHEEKQEMKAQENNSSPAKIADLHEKCDILRDLCDGIEQEWKEQRTDASVPRVKDLMARIEVLFLGGGDQTRVLKLCTIHRSKGREWKKVYLVGRNRYQPSVWAKSAEDLQQETNLMYVGVTRVKQELVEVEVPMKKNESTGLEWWQE